MIRAQSSQDEWDAYFRLRWECLREPWGQPLGSERDELEEQAQGQILVPQAMTHKSVEIYRPGG